MTDGNCFTRARLLLAVSMLALSAGLPARAQEAPPSTSSLLEEMVATGIITQQQADRVLKGAQARDAAKARAASQAPRGAAKSVAAATPATPAEVSSSRTPDGRVHVQYVPQVVKDQIKAEVKQEVMAQAKDEGWAAPNQVPDWVNRIHITGDVRMRGDGEFFPKGNDTGTNAGGGPGNHVNWASLNARSTPIDINSTSSYSTTGSLLSTSNAIPYTNWDQNRLRERIRARIGIEADLGDGFTTGIRLATGESSSPVSTNQTLGGSGGDFSKYQLWVDRAYIRYDHNSGDAWGVSASAGRFANPFFSTDLIWNNDINFDGVAVSGHYQPVQGLTPFLTIGAFPVYNTSFDYSTYNAQKSSSQDRWLYAAQLGTDWKVNKDTAVKVGAAYYHFNNIEGRAVDCPYDSLTCGSDAFRPTFAQQGNTYMALRNNNYSTFISGSGTAPNYQYFGLATPFHELALTGRVDYDGLKPVFPDQTLRITADGEFVKNLAFNKASIQAKDCDASTGACWNNDSNGHFNGGDSGVMLRLTAGTPALTQRWDWNVSAAYKYIESDAVVDAFNDSDFGMGGTNLKGFILGANLALSKNVWVNFRWMSADSIAGAHYANDVVLLDLNAKF